MSKWPVHATWSGPIVMIGFGSIGRGTLPLLLRHIACNKAKITIIDPSATWSHLIEKEGIAFVKQEITKQNYKSILTPLLTVGPGQAMIVNLTVDVGSIDIIKLARETNSLCIDTVNEPWPGFYYNTKLDNADRTNYKVREDLLEVRRKLGVGPTAVSCCARLRSSAGSSACACAVCASTWRRSNSDATPASKRKRCNAVEARRVEIVRLVTATWASSARRLK